MAAEMLEVLVGGGREEHHEEEHLAEGELAWSLALPVRGDPVMLLPVELDPVIKTAGQRHGRVFHRGSSACVSDTDTGSGMA